MILSDFYEAIMEQLTANIPEIKHFDMYFAQDEPKEEQDELPFNRPAILFEFEPMDFESFGTKKEAANITFNLHIISDVIQEVSKETSPTVRNLGHAHLKLIDDIAYYLNGFTGTGFSTLSRKSLDTYKPNGMMIKHVAKYGTRLTDTAAVVDLLHRTPDSTITTVVVK